MAEKEKPTVVAQDAIHIERIKKEEKLMTQHTKFHINPFRKLHILPDKPMSKKPPEEVSENSDFIKELHRAYLVPKKKYSTPQTESQEIGWESSPLIPLIHQDHRFHFHRVTTDITKHAEYARKTTRSTRESQSPPLPRSFVGKPVDSPKPPSGFKLMPMTRKGQK